MTKSLPSLATQSDDGHLLAGWDLEGRVAGRELLGGLSTKMGDQDGYD